MKAPRIDYRPCREAGVNAGAARTPHRVGEEGEAALAGELDHRGVERDAGIRSAKNQELPIRIPARNTTTPPTTTWKTAERKVVSM
jgi:hypothetical protein